MKLTFCNIFTLFKHKSLLPKVSVIFGIFSPETVQKFQHGTLDLGKEMEMETILDLNSKIYSFIPVSFKNKFSKCLMLGQSLHLYNICW